MRRLEGMRIAAAVDPIGAEEAYIERQATRQLDSVDEMAPQVVCFLSGEPRSAIGQAILVDGGATI